MLKVSFAQMEIKPGEYEKNFENMKNMVLRASKLYNSDLIVFPELAIQGAQKEINPLDDIYHEKFIELARENSIWLIPGSFYYKENNNIYNRLIVIDRNGEIKGKFDKIFPWEPYEPVKKGNDILVFDIENKMKIGVAICYDLFFPEIARSMTAKGAELLIYPHYTTTSDREAEINIAKAYAILNSAYVVTFNGVGKYLVGKSYIFGPEGEDLQKAEYGETILTEVFSSEKISITRSNGIKGVTKNYYHFLKYKQKLKDIINNNY